MEQTNSKEEHLLADADDVEDIPMTNITRVEDLASTQLRRRLDSTSSDVSFRQGRVYDNREKKQIPDAHKTALLLLVVVLTFAIPWLVYGLSRGEMTGIFREGEAQIEEDEYEHERDITLDGRDWAGFSLAALLIMIAAGGGIGGGGVLVPTYIFVLGFSPKYAIPLSNCTILGSSISNLILNINKRHPYADRPLIDWDIMLMMEPLTVAGALVGTFINVISPPWLITIMLVVLLVSAAYRTLSKGVKKFKEESLKMEQAAIRMDTNPSQPATKDGYEALGAAAEKQETGKDNYNAQTVLAWTSADVKKWWKLSLPPGCQEYIHIVDECELDGADLIDLDYISLSQFDVKKMLIMKILRRIKLLKQSLGIQENPQTGGAVVKVGGGDDDVNDQNGARAKAQSEGNQALVDILEGESIHPPWKVFLMFATTGGMLLLTILKGGGDINPLNLECGQTLYWVLTVAALPWVLLISFIARRHLLSMYYAKQEAGFEYLETDVQWDERATVRYPAICSTAGLCAGMFGIGGGIVKGPLMLEMGVLAPVTSATSATMILFTSSGASVSYLLFQQLNLHYGIVLFCLGLVFTMIGQIALSKVVKASGRNSLIILIIGITVALSAVAMGIESSGALIDLFNGHAESGGDICGAGGE